MSIEMRGADVAKAMKEELEKYEPSPDVEQVEDVVNNNNLTDVTDIVRELIADARATVSL